MDEAHGTRAALKIAGAFLVLAVLWITLSDRLVAALATDPALVTRLQTYKGLAFVALSAGLIYALVLRELRTRRAADVRALRDDERFRALIENIQDTVTVLDADGRVRYTSPSVERLTGYPPEDRVGRSILDLVVPEDAEEARAALAAAFATPGAERTATTRIRHADGTVRWVEVSARNLLHDPNVAGIVVNARDQTQRRQLEAEMRQAQKMEAVGRLAGGVAHDFNNLLTVILGTTESLGDSLGPEDERRAELSQLTRAVEQSQAMVRQLMTFSRRHVLDVTTVDAAERIRETVGLFQATIPSRIVVHLDLPGRPLPVRMGAGQLEQVVMNLTVNARDAIRGRGEIRVTVEPVELEAPRATAPGLPDLPPGRYVRVAVSDTGEGIPAEVRDNIFDPFFTTKPQGLGTGLGLAMVYGAVKQAGGGVWCTSTPGQGTTFEVLLPAAREALADTRPGPTGDAGAGSGAAPEEARVGTETVIVVDDDAAVRGIAARALRRFGYQVIEAADGDAALKRLAAAGHVDLVVTDAHMPGMDGPELIERARAVAPGVRALLVSGDTGQDDDLAAGLPFLEKPYTARGLAARVRAVLDDTGAV